MQIEGTELEETPEEGSAYSESGSGTSHPEEQEVTKQVPLEGTTTMTLPFASWLPKTHDDLLPVLVDELMDQGEVLAFKLPDWDDTDPAFVYMCTGKVVALVNPLGIQHERPGRQGCSNWVDALIHWKCKSPEEPAC